MKNTLKQIILDFHSFNIPVPSLRDFSLPELPQTIRKAFVFIGMRRSGKTWSMYQCMHKLLKNGIPKEKLVYINFEDDRLISFDVKNFKLITEAYFELYPDYSSSKDIFFFFDEIHEISGWEKYIRRLLDTEKVQIYISGSSSKMLGKEIATSLRGRTITQEIFPFSFREFLSFHKLPIRKNTTSKQKAKILHLFNKYTNFGGFPEAVVSDYNFFRTLLQGYLDVVIYRDIIERHNITNVTVLRELLMDCIQNASGSFSINKLYHRYKSSGKTIGKNSLYDFLAYFEDAYCLFSVPLFTFSRNRQNVNPRKIYAIDPGLISACTIKPDFEKASLLENTIFSALRRKYEKIFYYKTTKNKEVDFCIPENSHDTVLLIQVTVSMNNEETRKREISALHDAMNELNTGEGFILTESHEETIELPSKKIHCIPAWKWLLEN